MALREPPTHVCDVRGSAHAWLDVDMAKNHISLSSKYERTKFR